MNREKHLRLISNSWRFEFQTRKQLSENIVIGSSFFSLSFWFALFTDLAFSVTFYNSYSTFGLFSLGGIIAVNIMMFPLLLFLYRRKLATIDFAKFFKGFPAPFEKVNENISKRLKENLIYFTHFLNPNLNYSFFVENSVEYQFENNLCLRIHEVNLYKTGKICEIYLGPLEALRKESSVELLKVLTPILREEQEFFSRQVKLLF